METKKSRIVEEILRRKIEEQLAEEARKVVELIESKITFRLKEEQTTVQTIPGVIFHHNGEIEILHGNIFIHADEDEIFKILLDEYISDVNYVSGKIRSIAAHLEQDGQ